MMMHEVREGQVYAWRGKEDGWSTLRGRPQILRPVLLVDRERVWQDDGIVLRAHEWRKYPRLKVRQWGWLALRTSWKWALNEAPDDLDRQRVPQHVDFLHTQTDWTETVQGRPRVSPAQLSSAPPGIQPAWMVVHADELIAPWDMDIERLGSAAVEPSDWDLFGDMSK